MARPEPPLRTGGWRTLSAGRVGTESFEASPFTRLARAHAIAVAGDTLIAISLAGSLFFSIDADAARAEVLKYLALTMAPFAVLSPLVGPALDRAAGGRRWMVIGSSGLRAIVCMMLIGDIDTWLLFPEALALLVLSKSYHVAKSALVPTVVGSETELVEANSKLAMISGVVGAAAAVPGGLLLTVGGAPWVVGLAMIVFAVGVVVSMQLPSMQVATDGPTDDERDELRGAGVVLASTAMGLLRGIVGFLTFLLAFALRTGDAPEWHFGVVLALSAIGSLVGAAIAPALRAAINEERIIAGMLLATAAAALFGAWSGGLVGAGALVFVGGVGAAGSKQAFDSIVQRDAPDANRGRSFARFETRFQLIWVGGALLGLIPMPRTVGFLAIAGVAAFAAVSYTAGTKGAEAFTLRRLAHRLPTNRSTPADESAILGDAPTRQIPRAIAMPDDPPSPAPPPPTPPPPAIPPNVAVPPTDDDATPRTGTTGSRIVYPEGFDDL